MGTSGGRMTYSKNSVQKIDYSFEEKKIKDVYLASSPKISLRQIKDFKNYKIIGRKYRKTHS